jgi:uncharacterized membrane protein
MLFEVTPNWHPAIVHFPIALSLTGIVALWIGALLRDSEFNRQLQTFGHWNLRLGFVFAIIAAWFGLLAYMSVSHDAAGQDAKDMHRDFAIVTISAYIPFFILSCLRQRLTPHITRAFTVALIIPALMLCRTAWLGGEAVYRYGVGVERSAQGGGEHGQEELLPNTGDMRYRDEDFEKDTGEAVGGERGDNQGN